MIPFQVETPAIKEIEQGDVMEHGFTECLGKEGDVTSYLRTSG